MNGDYEVIGDTYGYERPVRKVELSRQTKESLEPILKDVLAKEEGSWGLKK